MTHNTIVLGDCIVGMSEMEANSVDFTLTDIPYGVANKHAGRRDGIRDLHKGDADVLTFALGEFLDGVYKVTKNSGCIFCSKEQVSTLSNYFDNKNCTTRLIIWEKTNPMPINGKLHYLSGVEVAVWFKKKGAKTFNASFKNTVFRFPTGKRVWHPTQKNLNLWKELIQDNTNEGDLVFDPCMGGGTTAIACLELNRNYFGFEISEEYYNATAERLKA